MSAESELAALIDQAVAAATGLSGQANSLLSSAIGELGADAIEFLDEFGATYAEQGVDVDGARFSAPIPTTPPPPDAADTDELQLAHPKRPTLRKPRVRALNELDADFAADFPTLAFPTFKYPKIAQGGRFDAATPVVDSELPELPEAPTLENPAAPSLLDLASLPSATLEIAAPALLEPPAAGVFAFDAPAQLAMAIGRIMADIDPVLAQLQQDAEADVASHFDAASTLEDWPGTGTLEPRLATLRDALTARIDAIATGGRSGWALPGPVQQALRASVAQWLAAMERWADSLLAARKVELREEYLRLMTGLFAELYAALAALRDRRAEQILAMHRAAAQYARRVAQAVLKTFEQQEYGNYDAVLDAALARLALAETNLKVELTRREIVAANQDLEGARQDMDGLSLDRYAADRAMQDLAIGRYAAEVKAAKIEVELQRQPWKLFVLQARLLAAKAGLQEALYSVASAQTSDDAALLEGAGAELDAYRQQIAAFEQELSLLEAADSAGDLRNEALLETYRSEVKAALGEAEMDLSDAKMDLDAYRARAKVYLAGLERTLEQAKASASFEDRQTAYETRVQEANRELVLELAGIELEHDSAVANVSETSAALLANLGESAMSALNSLARVAVEE